MINLRGEEKTPLIFGKHLMKNNRVSQSLNLFTPYEIRFLGGLAQKIYLFRC